MFEKLKPYKRYFGVSLAAVCVGVILILAYYAIGAGSNIITMILGVIGHFLHIISPVMVAFLLAYLLYYPMMWIEKLFFKCVPEAKREKFKGLIRLLSVTVVFLIVISFIVMIINFIIPPLIRNVSSLIEYIQTIDMPELRQWLQEMDSVEILNQFRELLITGSAMVVSGIGGFIGTISTFVIDFVVAVILTFYFLKDKEKLFATLNKIGTVIFSPKVKGEVIDFIKTLDDVVGKYLLASLLDSAIVGVVSTILMMLIKNPFAILIGFAAGITNIIPYVGPVVGAGLAFVLGLFSGGLGMGGMGAVLLLLYQQIDGNIIQPKIVGDQVGLLPVWILIAVLIGGSYFGGVGMIASVPVAALIAVYFDRLYKYKVRKMEERK